MKRKIEQEQVLKVNEELEGSILIVEGRKDEEALRKVLHPGQAHIVKINSRPIAEVANDADSLAEKHKNRGIIILTDFDRTGSRLASRLRLILQSRKIHANSRIRRDVMNLGIQRVEEMASVLGASGISDERSVRKSAVSRKSKIRERDDYGEIGANFNKVRGKGLHKGKGDNREARRDRGDIRAD